MLFTPDQRIAADAALVRLPQLILGLAGAVQMENVIRSRPQRSLVRRLLAPVASLALLAGGGWGAYQYYDAEQLPATRPSEINRTAHSAAATKNELKMLFAAEDSAPAATPIEKEKAVAKKTAPITMDRYAMTKPPELPPLVKPSVVEKSATLAPKQSALGNRYAALTAPSTPSIKPEIKEQKPTDIARGQEPSSNPLRAASAPLDARAAFGAALTQAPKTTTQPPKTSANPFPSNPPPAREQNQLSNALETARPLSASQLPASNRYQTSAPAFAASAPPALPATPAVSPRNSRPAPPLNLPAQRATQAPPLGARSMGAPPAGLGSPPSNLATSRTPSPAPPLALATAPTSRALPNGAATTNMTPTPGLANHPGTGRPGERLLEGVQNPAVTIQKLAPEEIQVGKRCTFAIRVQNSGQRTAHNVQIRDEVPRGTELVGTAPRASISGAEIIWDLGTLSPGEERTVEMELLPQEEGELGSVATIAFTAQASAKSRCTRPELALRLTSQPQVHVGDQHVVQIEVSNPGSGDATGVMLLETLPAGVSHEAGPALEFEVGTLRPGQSKRLELLLTAEQAGKISNVMTARADASLQVEASCEFEVIAPALQLSVEGPQRRFLERPATYRVSVDNPGTASAKDIQLVTHLPKGMQFVSANNMGEYNSSSHSVHWSLAELPANERGTVELIALPIESGKQTLQIATQAQQGLEDRTDKQVLVEGLSALMFEVTDVEGLIEMGGETTYEIRVQNQGSKAATNVQVVAIMDAGVRPVSAQGETRHAIQSERVIFAPLAQLAPKADTTFRIQAQGIRPGDQRVRVQITSDDTQQPITKEVSTRVYADE